MDFSAEDTKELFNTKLVDAVGGPLEGLEVKYVGAGNATSNGSTITAPLKLDEKSVDGAKEKVGMPKTPTNKGTQKALSTADNFQKRGDELFVRSFDKKLKQKVEDGTSFRPTGRPNYRELTAEGSPKNIFNRDRRRYLTLRNTFEKVAAQQNKQTTINAESLPTATITKMVEKAVSAGSTMTPVGALSRAVQLSGQRRSMSYWDAIERWKHAFMGGSFAEHAPQLRRE